MKPQIGLKVWSTNLNYLKPAHDLYAQGIYEFIELYIVPGSFKDSAKLWQELHIPMRFHAPHEINLAQRDKQKKNLELCEELKDFSQLLKAESIVFHPGLGGDLKSTLIQLPLVKQRIITSILIENMPYISLEDDVCPGSVYEDVAKLIEKCQVGFCFDICHAIKTAVYLNRDIKKFAEQFIDLKPEIIHLSDGHLNSIYDEHLSVGQGEFDLSWMSDVVCQSRCRFLVLETTKSSLDNLDDFHRDALQVKSLFEEKISSGR